MKHALIATMLCVGAWAQTKEVPKAAPKAATPAGMDLLKPDTIRGKAPAVFVARLQTTKGNIDIRVVRDWAPNGADRFYNLVRAGFYDNVYIFRVVEGFMAQFGISSNPQISKVWQNRNMLDDRVIQSNKRGFLTYAQTDEPNSRSTQLFINRADNSFLDEKRFAPFGEVVEGMLVVDQLYSGYGEQTTNAQGSIAAQGESYLNRYFPRLDKIVKATILQVVTP
jgi:peptidyl-prolyl cis-trans isomerase A (cyclophilin A)